MSSSSMNGARKTSRSAHAQAILGPELCERLSETKVLLVGAGGIGCELLKNIVLTGFGHITLLDLDTIDLSNLNRQFLFKKKDIKHSKAMVAAQTAGAFNPNVKIHPIHANIKEAQFDIEWFSGFDIVLNALDNLDARRHVNKMCMAAGVPLVESGTAGYLGQVQPLLKDRTECFDCVPKPTPTTFPVCTIRSTPSQPIHCIVWAKSYLLPQLFGEDEDGTDELDEAEKQGENAEEIAALRKEALAYKAVRSALRSTQTTEDVAQRVFTKVFHSDILNLLSMSDMWRARAAPTPLDFTAIQEGRFFIQRPSNSSTTTGSAQIIHFQPANGHANGKTPSASSSSSLSNGVSGLRDQRALSLHDTLELFISSTNRLAERLRKGEDTISFDKDDDDTLDFVTAAANLRSAAYYIDRKTRWEIKEMAGNIIPAIATTNAIISGLIVLQAVHLLRKSYAQLRNVHVQFKPTNPLSTSTMCPPNPKCGVCRDTYTKVLCDPARVTLSELVDGVLGGDKREVSVYEDKRVLSDPDWDDNLERTLESLNVGRGKFLTIVDEDEEWGTIVVALSILPPNHPSDGPAYILPSPLPSPPRLEKPHSTPPPASSRKRSAPDDEIVEVGPIAKRAKTDTNGASSIPDIASPNKRKRLEEDGLLMLSSKDDKIEDDVIEID
jgi:ubiquitin-like 1-activating enzyme E1 B